MKDKVLTDPRKLMAVELKGKGIDIEKICVPQRVYLLADDIFDNMVRLDCGEYKFPIGGKLWVMKDNPKVGFIKSMMCSPAIATQFYDNKSEINGSGALERFLVQSTYEDWLQKVLADIDIANIEKSRVPALTYFYVREEDDEIVGMINIRLALNDFLRNEGGHIGYCIRP